MNILRCCFSPNQRDPAPSSEGCLLASESGEVSSKVRAVGLDSSVVVFKSGVTSNSLSLEVDDLDDSNCVQECHSKACFLIQRLAEERRERDTASQVLQRSLRAVEAECGATFASVLIVSGDIELGLLGAPTDGPDADVKWYKVGDGDSSADRLLKSGSGCYAWSSTLTKQTPPSDCRLLGCAAALQYVMSVEIKSNNHLVGVLTVGFCSGLSSNKVPSNSQQLLSMLQLVCAAMSGFLRDSVLQASIKLFHQFSVREDLSSVVQKYLDGLNTVLSVDRKQTWFRLALLNSHGTAAAMFEDTSPDNTHVTPSGISKFSERDDFTVGSAYSTLSIKQSILKLVLQRHQQLLVPDTQRLLNQSRIVCMDIFATSLVKPPASAMVYPLKAGGEVYGALYVMSSARTDFGALPSRIREICNICSPQLLETIKRQPQFEAVKRLPAISQHSSGEHTSLTRQLSSSSRGFSFPASPVTDNDFCLVSSANSYTSSVSRTSAGSLTNVLVMGLADRICERRSKLAVDADCASKLSELQLTAPLGEGGFAKVFKGCWRGLPVAVKVVVDDNAEARTSMKHAHEIALLMSASHPGVLQAYVCMTDIPIASLLVSSVQPNTIQATTSYRFLVDNCQHNCHVQVLEYCDHGTLCRAIRTGLLYQGPSAVSENCAGAGESQVNHSIDMAKLLVTLLEIAGSLAYLHSLGVVHCDLKPTNILLKGSTSDPRGFTTKLADFGLSRIEDDGESACFPVNSCGTVPYVPPEGFASLKVDNSVDTYAFGVLMWEMYTGRIPYLSRSPRDVAMEVVGKGLRPNFPACTPPQLIRLAEACWTTNARLRPSFDYIQTSLRNILLMVEERSLPATVANQFAADEPTWAFSQPPLVSGTAASSSGGHEPQRRGSHSSSSQSRMSRVSSDHGNTVVKKVLHSSASPRTRPRMKGLPYMSHSEHGP